MIDKNLFNQGRIDRFFPNAFGIYVHVPFCLRRCRYCAFVSSVLRPVPDYARALVDECRHRLEHYLPRQLATLYFGGGTPTMLSDRDLAYVVGWVCKNIESPREITLEANPEHVCAERAKSWHDIGFTRISLGIQSFDDEMLAFLGRRHDRTQAVNAVQTLYLAGFDEISIDLIFGGNPNHLSFSRQIGRWRSDLELTRALGPAHVSCYELTLEPHTPLWSAQKHGEPVLCDENARLEMMRIIPGELGMNRYEISNYSAGGAFSAHNVSCWAGLPYLGLGPGAHSLWLSPDIQRRANAAFVKTYIAQYQEAHRHGAPFVPSAEFTELLSPQTHLAERLMCAARTRFYWSPEDIASQIGADIKPYQRGLAQAVDQGWLSCCDLLYQTTEQGIRFNNCLDEALFDGAPEA